MDYEEHIAQNLDHIPGKPKLIGRNYYTRGGVLDILAQYENGDLLVIEVKPGVVNIWACCQLLRYCGAIIEQLEILSSDKMVKGILIGKTLDKYAGLAFKALPKDQFQFIPLDELMRET
jgi:RecB family endonuclease NucS